MVITNDDDIALLLTAFNDHKLPQESTTKSRNYSNESKIKRTKSRIDYYATTIHTTVATFNFALSDEIEFGPEPGSNARNNTPKCSLCNKGVRTTRKHVQCSQCVNLTHITCSNIPKTEQKHYTARTVYAWLYSDCTLNSLPFCHSRDLDILLFHDSDYNVPSSQNEHHQKLNEHSKHTSIAHLNIQAIMLTFNEYVMMLEEYQFDIITLSGTWLQDCLFQQNHIQINGYNSVFKNRIGKRGGGIAFYIKESVTYKVGHNLSK